MNEILTRAEAASQRMTKYRTQHDRPSQRSAGERSGAPRLWTPAIRSQVRVERAAAGSKTPDAVRFEGMASVTGQGYTMYDWLGEYTELVDVDAFDTTLSRDGLDVPLVLDHVSSRRIARTISPKAPLELSAVKDGDTTGLLSVAPQLSMEDDDTRQIVTKMDLGLIDEMSFRFVITSGQWSPDFTEYHITGVDIHKGDVSIVGYGANPLTAGATVSKSKAEPAASRARALFDLYDVR